MTHTIKGDRVKFSKPDQFLQLPNLQARPIKPQGNIQKIIIVKSGILKVIRLEDDQV